MKRWLASVKAKRLLWRWGLGAMYCLLLVPPVLMGFLVATFRPLDDGLLFTLFASWLFPLFLLLLLLWARESPVNRLRTLGERERQTAFEGLTNSEREKAARQFVQALNTPYLGDGSDEVHRLAVEGLGRLKAKNFVNELVDALEHPRANVRATAIWALWQIGEPKAISALIPLLGDTAEVETEKLPLPFLPRVCDYAAHALRRMGKRVLVAAFEKALKGKLSTAAKAHLRQHRQEVVAGLLKALNSDEVTIARNAAWALGELGFVEALPPLRRKAQSLVIPEELRIECGEAVRKLEMLVYLPRAATGGGIDTSLLPRPAVGDAVNTANLPMAAEAPASEGSEPKQA